MLKHEVLDILTVQQWSEFRNYVADRPQKYVVNREGTHYVDFDERDVHEFLVMWEKMNADKREAGCGVQAVQSVQPERVGGSGTVAEATQLELFPDDHIS